MNDIIKIPERQNPETISELLEVVLTNRAAQIKIAETFRRPDLAKIILSNPYPEENNNEEKIPQVIEKLNKCERQGGKTMVWILTVKQANDIISNFQKWELCREGIVSAQTSIYAGNNIAKGSIDSSFGADREYLDCYRQICLPVEILDALPDIFREVKTEQYPDCLDPLAAPVEKNDDHSRLMVGDVILIPHLNEGTVVFKTIHFIVGSNIKTYRSIRENNNQNNLN